MKTKQSITPGPWQTYQLAYDDKTYGQNAGKLIVVAADGELEVCGVVPVDADAVAIAAVPELIAALEICMEETKNINTRAFYVAAGALYKAGIQ